MVVVGGWLNHALSVEAQDKSTQPRAQDTHILVFEAACGYTGRGRVPRAPGHYLPQHLHFSQEPAP